jgi:hypothetical protein
MRTTLTIDDDVAATLERLRRNRDTSLKDLINEALRRGLRDMDSRPTPRARCSAVRGLPLAKCPGAIVK